MEVINSSSTSAGGKQISRNVTVRKSLFRHFRSARVHHKNKAAGIGRAKGEEGLLDCIKVVSRSSQEKNGVLRMKILVRKEDLEKVLELMRNRNNINKREYEEEEEASKLIEERLNVLRKKHRRHNSWSPVLQTIPEDILAY